MAIFKCIHDSNEGGIDEIIIGERYIDLYYQDCIRLTKPTAFSEEMGWRIGSRLGVLPVEGSIWHWYEISFNKYLKLCK